VIQKLEALTQTDPKVASSRKLIQKLQALTQTDPKVASSHAN